MPYNPTWQNPYMPQQTFQQFQQQTPSTQYAMPYQQQVQQGFGSIKVDGPTEAMNRFLMHYPANMLVPGFVSEPLFDVNGRQFYALSVEVDGRRNLETFDYERHDANPIKVDGAQFVSRQEFDEFAAKVNAVLGAQSGIYGPIQSTPTNTTQGPNVDASPDDAGRPVPIASASV